MLSVFLLPASCDRCFSFGKMPCCPAALYVPRKMNGYGALVRTVTVKGILNRIAMNGRVKRAILGKRQNTDAMSVRKARTFLRHGLYRKE